jgi:oligopeptide/dipeptide ABC transporter ATP-binding protein
VNDSSRVLLSVRNLAVDYGAHSRATSALAGVDFDLARGESLAIAGESGSGKSTLALAVLGLLPRSARITGGSLLYQGRELSTLARDQWPALRGKQLGYVPQDGRSAFDPLLSVGAQIEQLLKLREETRHAATSRSLELLREVGLDQAQDLARELPGRLSGGQLQRASIAAAIAQDPQLLVADEPTSALDPAHARALIDVLDGLRRKRGLALLWISHDLRAIEARATRVIVLYAGRAVESGPAREVIGAPRHPYTRLLVRSLPTSPRGERLAALALPDPDESARRSACRFHSRCPLGDEHCRTWEPALTADAQAHAVACHYLDQAVKL